MLLAGIQRFLQKHFLQTKKTMHFEIFWNFGLISPLKELAAMHVPTYLTNVSIATENTAQMMGKSSYHRLSSIIQLEQF